MYKLLSNSHVCIHQSPVPIALIIQSSDLHCNPIPLRFLPCQVESIPHPHFNLHHQPKPSNTQTLPQLTNWFLLLTTKRLLKFPTIRHRSQYSRPFRRMWICIKSTYCSFFGTLSTPPISITDKEQLIL